MEAHRKTIGEVARIKEEAEDWVTYKTRTRDRVEMRLEVLQSARMPIPTTKLMKKCNLTTATFEQTTKFLIKKGFMERLPQPKKARKIKYLYVVTKKGLQLLDQIKSSYLLELFEYKCEEAEGWHSGGESKGGYRLKQSKLFDYPYEEVKADPEARVIRPPRKRGEEIIVYTPKHREVPEVAVVSLEEAERAKEVRRREIAYHKMRMEK